MDLVDNPIRIELSGRIDSSNAAAVEKDLMEQVAGKAGTPLILKAEKLAYISSAGLRILLRLRKQHPDMTITGVNSEVYEILEMTGFTEMMIVRKAYRVVSVDGCEEIGHGANGIVYRIDKDNVVKVYKNANALVEIQHEREVARLALILGIPTAISYDVVRVGDSYGSVFELLNARSFSDILAKEPERLDWCVKEYVTLLKKIHETMVPEGKLPPMKQDVLEWVGFLSDYLPEEAACKLQKLVEAVPDDPHMLHGDYHTKNVQLVNDEVLLIDMDTLSTGHPIFELAFMYNAYQGRSELDHTVVKNFQGFDYEISTQFWHKTLAAYLETDDEARIREVEEKARIIGYARLIRSMIRRGEQKMEPGKALVERYQKELLERLEKVDTLTF